MTSCSLIGIVFSLPFCMCRRRFPYHNKMDDLSEEKRGWMSMDLNKCCGWHLSQPGSVDVGLEQMTEDQRRLHQSFIIIINYPLEITRKLLEITKNTTNKVIWSSLIPSKVVWYHKKIRTLLHNPEIWCILRLVLETCLITRHVLFLRDSSCYLRYLLRPLHIAWTRTGQTLTLVYRPRVNYLLADS